MQNVWATGYTSEMTCQGTQALELYFPSRFSITFRMASRVDWPPERRPWSIFMMPAHQENAQAATDHSLANMGKTALRH